MNFVNDYRNGSRRSLWLILVILSLGLASCSKRDFEGEAREQEKPWSQPLFYLKGRLNGNTFEYKIGDSNYIALTRNNTAFPDTLNMYDFSIVNQNDTNLLYVNIGFTGHQTGYSDFRSGLEQTIRPGDYRFSCIIPDPNFPAITSLAEIILLHNGKYYSSQYPKQTSKFRILETSGTEENGAFYRTAKVQLDCTLTNFMDSTDKIDLRDCTGNIVFGGIR